MIPKSTAPMESRFADSPRKYSTPKAIEWLCDPQSKVSSHYVVTEDGGIVQLVPEERRAWHAGVSSWEGMNDVNSRSIGIEIGHPGHAGGYPEFPGGQIDAVVALCRDLVARHRNASVRRHVQPAQQIQQRRLARSARPHKRDEFPLVHVEVQSAQHINLLSAAPVLLIESAYLNQAVSVPSAVHSNHITAPIS